MGFSGGSDGKQSACNAGDLGSIPGSRRSSGEETEFPLQYSCLENSMDRGAGRARVHEVARSRTRLSKDTRWHSGKQKTSAAMTPLSVQMLLSERISHWKELRLLRVRDLHSGRWASNTYLSQKTRKYSKTTRAVSRGYRRQSLQSSPD